MKKLTIIIIALLLASCSFVGAKRDITLTNLTDYSIQGIYNRLSQTYESQVVMVEGYNDPQLPKQRYAHWNPAHEMVRAKIDGEWIYFAYDERTGKVTNYEWPVQVRH